MDEGADIAIVDRRAHTIPSDYVDVGLDATVDTRGIDFVFQNNTEYPLFIFAEVKNVEGRSSRYQITVYVYGEPLPEGVTYKSRSEITEVISREAETVYTNVTSIPTGYQKERIEQRAGYIAEAYLDKYVNGERVEEESKLLYTDRYKGNPAEIDIGTGPALQAGEAVPEGLVPVGTPHRQAGFHSVRQARPPRCSLRCAAPHRLRCDPPWWGLCRRTRRRRAAHSRHTCPQ